MSDAVTTKPPAWYWVVAILGLLFELFGVYGYLMAVGVLPREMTEVERALLEGMPAWATAAYAIAVFAGALGAIGLVLRKGWSQLLLILSLGAVLAQFSWWLLLSGAREMLGPSAFTAPAVVTLIAATLVWVAGLGIKRGWLS